MNTAAPSSSPRSRRFTVVALVMATAMILSACLTPEQDKVLSELNADRQANNRTTLAIQNDAQAKAQAWAEKLAREGKLYHSRLADGINVRWCGLGENVGYGGSVATIQDAYMRSSGHKANILNTTWNGVGVGHARGKVNGHNVIFTVQVFIKTC